MRKKTAVFSYFIFCLAFSSNAQFHEDKSDAVLSIIFSGDIMGHLPQTKAAYNPNTKSYEYDVCFEYVKKYIKSADIAVANLETPIAGTPYSGYPCFSSPDALLDGLKKAGYDILLTANNHVADKGKKGLERTIQEIQKRRLLHIGSYVDEKQRDEIYPLVIENKGVRIAFFNYTYDTNGIPVTQPNFVNIIDTVQIKKDLIAADEIGVDLKIMTIHWGEEYQLKANKEQRKLADLFIRNGVDAVIGAHPHVVQDMEVLYKADGTPVPVFYSLGNSISNQRKPHTDGGIMVKLMIDTNSKKIIDSSFLPVWVYKGFLKEINQYHLIPTTDFVRQQHKFAISEKDSLSLLFFHEQTLSRLNNVAIMPDVYDYKTLPIWKRSILRINNFPNREIRLSPFLKKQEHLNSF